MLHVHVFLVYFLLLACQCRTQVQHDYVHSLQVCQAVSVLMYVHTVTWQYVGGVSSCVGGVSP